MQTPDRSATAFEKVATLSAQREKLHALRFAYVKLHRAVLDVERLLNEGNLMTTERNQVLLNIRQDAMIQRSDIWTQIENLDSTITTEMHRLNNGVYDE